MATVTREGQATLPKEVRDASGSVSGSDVEPTIEPGGLWSARGFLPRSSIAEAGIPEEGYPSIPSTR
jgi:bifunctional DNA-binding transcriptional regulator/antitoxin component of YhaV-PrlF toxin-antitoxin module